MSKAVKHRQRIILFDAHAILHRAYHALPDFVSAKGEPTGGLYGLGAMLIKTIADLKPDYMAACYDLPEPTFRKEVYAEYKAGRPKADDALVAQLQRSRDVFTAFGIPIYDKAGFEADDILGTVVEELKGKKDLQIIIASGDMDTMQLIDDDRVVVYTLKKGINDTVMYDEKAVVARFGFEPKYLTDYKGLRGDPSDNIVGVKGIGEKTASDLIGKFGTIEKMYEKLKRKGDTGVKDRIKELLLANEEEALFSKMLATIRRDAPIDFKLPEKTWMETFDKTKVEQLFRELEFKSLISRVNAITQKTNLEVKLPNESNEEDKPVLDRKLAIALWLLDSNKTNAEIDDVYDYTGTHDLAEAEKILLADIKKNKLEKVYEEIELPLIPIIEKAQARGIKVDAKYLAELGKKYHAELSKYEKKIYEQAGGEFNINSPKQLGEILFDKMEISTKGLKKTGGGARSTRESELLKLAENNPIVKEILSYRELQKLLSTYIDNLPKMLDANGRLHTTLNQTGTTTGRMSSNNPNLQNIPAGGDLGNAVRTAFVAEKGYKFVDFDYSQIEMRVLAVLSGDKELIKIFKEGKDVHTAVASLVFGVPEGEVTKEMRRKAKVINFGIIYGMGVNALKTNLGSTREEAEKFYDDYFRKLPEIKNYFDNVIADAYKDGYTETYFGRRRYLPELKSKLPFVRSSGERMAMNAPLQGTAADIMKIAMRRADEELRKAKLDSKVHLLLQIHDELLYEVEEGAVEQAKGVIERAITNIIEGEVPFTAHSNIGNNWGELK